VDHLIFRCPLVVYMWAVFRDVKCNTEECKKLCGKLYVFKE
jgi:hypothetical protein